MRLRIFQAGKGDALVLSSNSGGPWTHVLLDGGMRSPYRTHVAPRLPELEPNGDGPPVLDLVIVSHIDEDHIAGILQLTDDHIDWRVYDYQSQDDDLADVITPPGVVRPPEFLAIWHNAFHEQIEDNEGEISDLLAAMVPWLQESSDADAQQAGLALASLETSKTQAHRLSRRIGASQLDVPLNAPADAGLITVERVTEPVEVGGLRFRVIGPFEEDLEKLRKEWNTWLETAQDALDALREEAERDEQDLGNAELNQLAALLKAEQQLAHDPDLLMDLAAASGADLATAEKLGSKSRVTYPNRASLMLVCEEDGDPDPVRMVLTGDGHHKAILAGLEKVGLLNDDEPAHVDVLKLPHHGSEHNADEAFFRRVIADHYVICANGAHENPDLAILDALLDSRLGDDDAISGHERAADPFTLWFATSPHDLTDKEHKHMVEVEKRVNAAMAEWPGRVSAEWSSGDFIDLEVSRGAAPELVRISAALPSPKGTDAGNEWVEVTNRGGTEADLTRYRLADRQNGQLPLDGTLAPGETEQFQIPAGTGIRLANIGDEIRLLRDGEQVHAVTYPAVEEDEIVTFDD